MPDIPQRIRITEQPPHVCDEIGVKASFHLAVH